MKKLFFILLLLIIISFPFGIKLYRNYLNKKTITEFSINKEKYFIPITRNECFFDKTIKEERGYISLSQEFLHFFTGSVPKIEYIQIIASCKEKKKYFDDIIEYPSRMVILAKYDFSTSRNSLLGVINPIILNSPKYIKQLKKDVSNKTKEFLQEKNFSKYSLSFKKQRYIKKELKTSQINKLDKTIVRAEKDEIGVYHFSKEKNALNQNISITAETVLNGNNYISIGVTRTFPLEQQISTAELAVIYKKEKEYIKSIIIANDNKQYTEISFHKNKVKVPDFLGLLKFKNNKIIKKYNNVLQKDGMYVKNIFIDTYLKKDKKDNKVLTFNNVKTKGAIYIALPNEKKYQPILLSDKEYLDDIYKNYNKKYYLDNARRYKDGVLALKFNNKNIILYYYTIFNKTPLLYTYNFIAKKNFDIAKEQNIIVKKIRKHFAMLKKMNS